MLRRKETNTTFIVFGLTRLGLESTIYRTRDKHTNYYTTYAVENKFEIMIDEFVLATDESDDHIMTIPLLLVQ